MVSESPNVPIGVRCLSSSRVDEWVSVVRLSAMTWVWTTDPRPCEGEVEDESSLTRERTRLGTLETLGSPESQGPKR